MGRLSVEMTLKHLPDGKAFHSITYGKGNMGAHGNVLTPERALEGVTLCKKPKS